MGLSELVQGRGWRGGGTGVGDSGHGSVPGSTTLESRKNEPESVRPRLRPLVLGHSVVLAPLLSGTVRGPGIVREHYDMPQTGPISLLNKPPKSFGQQVTKSVTVSQEGPLTLGF